MREYISVKASGEVFGQTFYQKDVITPAHHHAVEGFDPSQLHVINVVSNPMRFKSRYRLQEEFNQHMIDSGVTLYTVEIAFGDRPYFVTTNNNPRHLQLRSSHEIWHKEQMINLAVQRLLPSTAKYIAWVDCDVKFNNDKWAAETIHALQHFDVVQCYEECIDLNPRGGILQQGVRNSFARIYKDYLEGNKGAFGNDPKRYGYAAYAHPGYAWACTSDAFNKMGGLLDTCVMGSADYVMAMGLIGLGDIVIRGDYSDGYKKAMKTWCDRAFSQLHGNIGFVEGLLIHNWHGKKTQRGYQSRERVLADIGFDPYKHLKTDSNGLYAIDQHNAVLRNSLRQYFRARNEDSVDV